MDLDAMERHITAKLALAKAGVKSPDELSPQRRSTLKMLGVNVDAVKSLPPDEIEVIEADEQHEPECEVHAGGECDCIHGMR